MDSYRPLDRDRARAYDDQDEHEDLGFQIRGRASMDARRERERERERGRAYRDVDEGPPPRSSDHRYHDGNNYAHRSRREDNYSSDYSHRSRREDHNSSDYSHRSRHENNNSSDYYSQPQTDLYDTYDEPQRPADNNGDADVASEDDLVLPFLLIRGIKANVDETLLSKGLGKLYIDEADTQTKPRPTATATANLPGAPNRSAMPDHPGAALHSLKRVFIIRDRVTNKSLQYGFAEYHSKTDAKAALAKANDLGDRCTVASKRIVVCFPHPGVFPPTSPRDDPRYTFQMANGNFHKYYDQRYWASSLVINEEAPVRPKSPSPPKQAAPKTKKRTNPAAGDTLENQGKKSKIDGPPSTMMQKWQKKQAELRGEEDESDETYQDPASGVASEPGVGEGPKHVQSFIFDGERNGKHFTVCLLCFTDLGKTKTLPKKHVEGSAKHKSLLQDSNAHKQGLDRLKEWGVAEEGATLQIPITQPDPPAPVRDRAKERREQEAKSGTAEKINLSLKTAKSKTKPNAAQPSAPPQPSAPAPPSYGKGMNMLQKAGWKEGQSLGDGSGRTQIIEQNVFMAGVGLGHEGGMKGDAVEEAERLTKGDGKSFLDRTKDAARERYEKMG